MATTIKCLECGHAKQSEDGEGETCPLCEGRMTAPPKKKYQAKAMSLEDEERAKKKSKTRDEDDRPKKKAKPSGDDDENEGDRPKPKKKVAEALSLDDDEDEGNGTAPFALNGKAAEQLELDPGFKNRALMKQVGEELARGEVLHFACRPSEAISKKQALVAMGAGAAFALLGLIGVILILTVFSSKVPWYVAFVPLFIGFVGGLIAVLGPIMTKRQARLGWYAVTDRRAIVFNINLWGKAGHVEVYEPSALRKMWIKKSFWVKGGGSLIFKTEVHDNRTKYVDKYGRTVKETGTRTEHHYGFLNIEDVKDVETLVHEVLLNRRRDDDEGDD